MLGSLRSILPSKNPTAAASPNHLIAAIFVLALPQPGSGPAHAHAAGRQVAGASPGDGGGAGARGRERRRAAWSRGPATPVGRRPSCAPGPPGSATREGCGSTEPVILERPQTNPVETPCLLYLQCSKQLAEITFVEVVSEAKTMEVYTEEEYCGTCQGQRLENSQINSGHKQILLFKKYFKLEFPSSSCELKLLSLGGKAKVQIGEILLGIRHASIDISRGISPLGKNINMQRVQTMMDSMGTKLSPGAQQLLNMVQFQQKNQAAIGGLFQGIFGTRNLTEIGKVIGSSRTTGLSEEGLSSHECIETNPIFTSQMEETKGSKEIFILNGESTETRDASNLANGINNKKTEYDSEASARDADEHKFAGGDLQELVSTYLCKQNNGEQNSFSSDMLPFLRNLCSQVNELRIGEKTKAVKHDVTEEDGTCDRLYQQTFCVELEKHITEHMESMEQRLKDYIDHRINILQDDLDKKFVSLTKLIENAGVKRTATKEIERGAFLTNGDV
ncbi:ATPase PAAT isoform X2 [Leucoraja erinacea]|uniref:ATPase PAAT isoform X2 n=1 Tax=Leucoraja erinaceus TaxID=7782 RepID=UPI00245713A2|nr:ATPase PAAT isoform X2 [Leucoraja erinacea]